MRLLLVIDPIFASTFLGGSNFDEALDIALDSAGNVYVVGGTRSSDFPGIGAGSADSTFAGDSDAFVVKLNSNLSSILAATFLGGGSDDFATAITLDGMGNVYVAGLTFSSNFPVAPQGAADGTFAGNNEAFVVKLNSDLSSILASTFLGGSDNDEARGIVLDSAGDVYVTGLTFSLDFPGIGAGSADSTFAGEKGFVAKLNSSLSTILAATFVGAGNTFDEANGIALDSQENVYVAGDTGPLNSQVAGSGQASVVKLNPNLSSILASTFLGGSDLDAAVAITFDGAGNVYVAGGTNSSDFPGVGSGSADSKFAGSGSSLPEFDEGFVTELDPNLSAAGAPTATPTGSPTPTKTPSPTKASKGGGCSIGGPVEIETAMANVLMPLIPAFVVGLMMIRKRRKKGK